MSHLAIVCKKPKQLIVESSKRTPKPPIMISNNEKSLPDCLILAI